MMYSTATRPGRGTLLAGAHSARRGRDRGFVLIVAIAVLAILVILVYGLAASQDLARGRAALDNARRTACELAQVALDSSVAPPAAAERPTTATATVRAAAAAETVQTTTEGKFLAASRPAKADEPCYAPPLLAHREGDRVAAVCVSVPLGAKYLRLTQTYLVNTAGEKARRVLLRESLATDIDGELAAGDLGALQKEL